MNHFFIYLFLTLVSLASYANETSDFDTLLNHLDTIKSTQPLEFSNKLQRLNQQQDALSPTQRHFLYYLNEYESAYSGKIDDARKWFSLLDNESSDFELKFRAGYTLVNAYAVSRDWSKGLIQLEETFALAEHIHDPTIRAGGFIVAGMFYSHLGQYDSALDYAEKLSAENLPGRYSCYLHYIKIDAFNHLNLIADNMDLITAGVKECINAEEPVMTSFIKIADMKLRLSSGNIQDVITTLQKELPAILKTNYMNLIAEAYSLLAHAHLLSNDLVSAEVYALKAVASVKEIKYSEPAIKAYSILKQTSQEKSDFQSALKYQELYSIADKGYMDELSHKQIAYQVVKQQVAEKNHKITILKKQKEITELNLETHKKLQMVWATILISIAILIFFWFYRKTTQKEIARQKQVNWELQELDKLKDRILTNTSHELRTPLNGIIGLSELIILEYENEVKDELISSIRLIGKSGTRLALMVNDILDLAQLKSGKIRFLFQEFDLSILIKDVINLCLPLIKIDQVKIEYSEQNQSIIINQDKHRIQQILFNLIGNAIKFTEKGIISVHCERQNENFLIQVKDTGIGIPADKVNRVFEGFEQVDNGNTRKHQGSGIGLAITREIVTALGGEISIQSKLGEGSLVSLTLPLSNQEKP